MAPNSLWLTKNNSGQNLTQNSQWWAFGHCWDLLNMAALLKKLQAQSSCAHQSQQSMPLHGYKEFKLQAGPWGSGALQVSFSDWLSLRQGEWGCKCTVLFFSEKQRWKRKALNWEHSNFLLFAVLTNKCHPIRSIHFFKPITSTSSFYLRNIHASTAPPILKYLLIGTSQREPLST